VVKIGFTSRLVDDRMNDLNTAVPQDFRAIFRLPTQDARRVEQKAHALLQGHRIPGKEFFSVSPEKACQAVRDAARDVNGIHSFAENINYIKASDRIFLPLTNRDYFVWLRYEHFFDTRPSMRDIWQVHSSGDVLELHGADRIEQVSGFSDDDPDGILDPVPYLDRKQNAPNGHIIGRERLIAGDRLLWLSTDEGGSTCVSRIFEISDYCQVVCRTWTPQVTADGILLLNFLVSQPPEVTHNVVRAALTLPGPRSWSMASRDEILRDLAGTDTPPPDYWIPKLRKEERRRHQYPDATM
jgi:hypothetical protein